MRKAASSLSRAALYKSENMYTKTRKKQNYANSVDSVKYYKKKTIEHVTSHY